MSLKETFKQHPSYLKKGKQWLANKFGCSENEVEEAKEALQVEKAVIYEKSEKVDVETGDVRSEYIVDFKPKSIEQLYILHNIDKKQYTIKNYWSKVRSSGKFTSSVFAVKNKEEVFDVETALESIKKIVSSSVIHRMKVLPITRDERILFIYLSDEHCGTDMSDSIYNTKYNVNIYKDRLSQIVESIPRREYRTVNVVTLGDGLDGFNSSTTRGGHELQTLSNKEQFDIFFEGRKHFYDSLITSGVAKEYFIHNLNNSNHSGKGFEYIANKALHVYLNAAYSNVYTQSYNGMFFHIVEGGHTFVYTHGKDEKYQTKHFPLNLDDRTTLYFLKYFERMGIKNRYMHIIKGDLHRYNCNNDVFRYLNVPSVLGSSVHSEINYGGVAAGAIIEELDLDRDTISTTPIFF